MSEAQEHELKFSVDENIQAKFSLVPSLTHGAAELLKRTFGWARFQIEPMRVESLRDEYFDTRDWKLQKAGVSLRVRHADSTLELAVKILVSLVKGEFKRTERSQIISSVEYDALVRSGFVKLAMLADVQDLRAESCELCLSIENQRQYFSVSQNDERYRLALDTFVFVDPKTSGKSSPNFEVELEAESSAARMKLPTVRRQLMDVLEGQMEFSASSKYDRGAEFIKALRQAAQADRPSVFIVHGHTKAVVDHTARFLESGGAKVIVLSEQPDRGQTIIEKFEQYSRRTDYAVVFLTADDRGGPAGSSTTNHRARQNVIFELGFFVAALGRGRVCVLRDKGVEMPSDYSGVVYLSIDSAGAWKTTLGHRLRDAGIHFDMNRAGVAND